MDTGTKGKGPVKSHPEKPGGGVECKKSASQSQPGPTRSPMEVRTEEATFIFSGLNGGRHPRDYPSRRLRAFWTGVDSLQRVIGGRQKTRPPAQSECPVSWGRAPARPLTHRMKRAGPRTEPEGRHVRPETSSPERHWRGLPLPRPAEKTGSSRQSKAEDREPVIRKREASARPKQKSQRIQWWPK